MRMRKTRGGFLMGVKWAPTANESVFERRELEVKTRASEPNLKALDYHTAAELLDITLARLAAANRRAGREITTTSRIEQSGQVLVQFCPVPEVSRAAIKAPRMMAP